VYLLTRSARYFYDADAVREESQVSPEHAWRYGYGRYKAATRKWDAPPDGAKPDTNTQYFGASSRNLRNVWTIATEAFPEAHFATYPTALVERCIRAGSKRGDIILDPFAGSGTTLLVAERLQRDSVGIELNAEYVRMARERIARDAPLLTEAAYSTLPAAPPQLNLLDLMAAD